MAEPNNTRRVIPLLPGELLVEASWGGFMVVPTFNLDVAIGVVRDGVIEPWTTRLVQDLLRPGDIYLNAGANFGYYVCLAGRLVGAEGKVIGVEPNPYILPFLMKSLFWNGTINHSEVFARALSAEIGEVVPFGFDPQYLGGGNMFGFSRPAPAEGMLAKALETAFWSADTVSQLLDAEGKWIRGQGTMLPFMAKTTTIDNLVHHLDLPRVDLLHLDIEGAEPFALLGAQRLIETAPRLRMITEWAADHYSTRGSPALRGAFDAVWAQTERLGWRVRHIESRIAPNGGIYLSSPLTHEQMTTSAPHGDYFWAPAHLDLGA
jgi:FkbM family methyltransferase